MRSAEYMQSSEIREKFLEYFKQRNHTIVPSSSLMSDDPSVLLTSAGMQQFKPYFTGELNPERDFGSKNTISVQKCFRTSDIDEVGDESHLTFFEMLGNFSFGGYFKEKAIQHAYEFITKEMGLDVDYVTVFDPAKVPDGDWRKDVSFDEDSVDIWKNIGIPDDKIIQGGVDNFWGPTGAEGPCGPTTEIYVSGTEIWNIVFNEFYVDAEKTLRPLEIPGVDTGMGLERLAMVVQKKPTIFETDLFTDLVPPEGFPTSMSEGVQRIVLDHARAIAFLISDEIRPLNKEQGYILRRLIRRAIAHYIRASLGSVTGVDVLSSDFPDFECLLSAVVRKYKEVYPELEEDTVLEIFKEENSKFKHAISAGLRELGKAGVLDAKTAFKLYGSFGLTFEVIKDFAGDKAKNLTREDFDREFEKHQEVSRAGVEKRFGGHGMALDAGELKVGTDKGKEKILRLHTATHLLHQALRDMLGNKIRQEGSDINPERARFDFSFDRKLTDNELKKIESIVNKKIEEDLPVRSVEMSREQAEQSGALHFFGEKYPETVTVYYVGQDLDSAYSKEFCGGPHISRTGEIGKFEILKQESVGRNIKRIRANVL